MTHSAAATASTSVVIAAYTLERREALAQAVVSVRAQDPPPGEVVVAIDNNTQLYEWALRQLPGVVTVHNESTHGASATRNAGARVASGTVLAFLDDDAVARPDWLRNLIAPLGRPNVAGVGGYMEPIWLGRAPRWMPEEFLWVVGASYRGMPKTASPVRNVWSVNMAVHREDFWAVDGFREEFCKTGHVSRPEDTEFCIRLTTALKGRTWWYEPFAKAGHSVPPVRGTLRFFVWRCYNEGQGKAEMAALIGRSVGLQDERRHAARTLPAGISRELRHAVLKREFAALQRASAIGVGLGATGLGYVLRRASAQITT
jgi:glycosyltransferase involved in cell wall biosynthesis